MSVNFNSNIGVRGLEESVIDGRLIQFCKLRYFVRISANQFFVLFASRCAILLVYSFKLFVLGYNRKLVR